MDDLKRQPQLNCRVRIRTVVVDQTAGIERNGAVRTLDHNRVGMAAQSRLLLEKVYPVAAAQEMRGGQAGNAGPDNGDCLHAHQKYQ